MKAAVLVFPGSNCDRDLAVALKAAGYETEMVWHKETELPAGIDVVADHGGKGGPMYSGRPKCEARAQLTRLASSPPL